MFECWAYARSSQSRAWSFSSFPVFPVRRGALCRRDHGRLRKRPPRGQRSDLTRSDGRVPGQGVRAALDEL